MERKKTDISRFVDSDATLSDRYKAEAVAHGLCDQWTSEWKDDSTKDELIDKFVRGIDFCIKTGWPSVEQIKEFMPEANIHGVYADQDGISLRNPSQVVLNGDCDAFITVDDSISTVWVRHDSKVHVRVRRGGTVFLRLFDDCDVTVDCGFFSKCVTFIYSHGVRVSGNDDDRTYCKYGQYDGDGSQPVAE